LPLDRERLPELLAEDRGFERLGDRTDELLFDRGFERLEGLYVVPLVRLLVERPLYVARPDRDRGTGVRDLLR
jgi:hypothetical protein